MCDVTWSRGNDRKGEIKWPSTLIGSRRAVRCKYAYTEPIYLSRDCVADVNSTSETWAVWGEWNDSYIDALCPDPPFTVATQALYDSLVCLYFVLTDISSLQPIHKPTFHKWFGKQCSTFQPKTC